MTTKPPTTKRVLFRIGCVFAALLGLFFGSALFDAIPFSAARPPENLKTIEDFLAWKTNTIKGKGTFENLGATYAVMFAPAGRYLASGPSAYLFDDQGQFVDWTHDMGDFHTPKYRFDLTSGNVKYFEQERP